MKLSGKVLSGTFVAVLVSSTAVAAAYADTKAIPARGALSGGSVKGAASLTGGRFGGGKRSSAVKSRFVSASSASASGVFASGVVKPDKKNLSFSKNPIKR